MKFNLRRYSRKWHRWGAILIALPFIIVLVSGLLLQVKKEFSWIQPPTAEGSTSYTTPEISLQEILEISSRVPEASIADWEDIDRLDLRPVKGIVKVRSNSSWELQIDLATGAVLSSQMRRSDIIEAIHDGSWFHDKAKLWIFLPAAVIVTLLWMTGIYLFFLPYFARWQNRKKMARRIRQRRKERRSPSDSSPVEEPEWME
ncbi:MAG: PepSY-associated TM helix domain-containing protein [Balneolaceae bacterium]|nr:PepSY-associated TM helix domain-containing protein [Balneolaceae bacterium]